MQADITPQPDDGVRQALLAALAPVPDAGDRGPWWRTGLEETLDDCRRRPCDGASHPVLR